MSATPTTVPTSPWDAPLFCHVPGEGPVSLEALADTQDGGDRWNEPGEPTAYLSSDVGVALLEFGRHNAAGKLEASRRLLCLSPQPAALARLVDLRDEAVLQGLALSPDPAQFLDRSHARSVARRVREHPAHQGLIVPSMGLLDATERCNVVLFADRLEGGMAGAVATWTSLGELQPTRERDDTR